MDQSTVSVSRQPYVVQLESEMSSQERFFVQVKNFPATYDREALLQLFAAYSSDIDCEIIPRPGKGPIGFVYFTKKMDAFRAVYELNGELPTDGTKPLKTVLLFAPPKETSLFIKNLPQTADNWTLKSIFSPFGQICSVRVIAMPNSPFRYGLVSFLMHEQALAAATAMHGHRLAGGGAVLHVEFYKTKKERAAVMFEPQKGNSESIRRQEDNSGGQSKKERAAVMFEPQEGNSESIRRQEDNSDGQSKSADAQRGTITPPPKHYSSFAEGDTPRPNFTCSTPILETTDNTSMSQYEQYEALSKKLKRAFPIYYSKIAKILIEEDDDKLVENLYLADESDGALFVAASAILDEICVKHGHKYK